MSVILRKKLVAINSVNRTSGTPSNFQIQFTDEKLFTDTHKIKLNKIVIPNSFHNLNQSELAYIISDQPGITRVFQLPKGQYSSSDIIDAFATYVATYAGGEVLSVDPISDHFQMTSINGNITILSGAYPSNGYDDLADILGFGAQDYSSTLASAQSLPKLNGLSNVYVHFSFLTRNCISPVGCGLQQTAFTMINLAQTNYGEVCSYEGTENDFAEFQQGSNTSNFNVYLTDDQGRALDINGVEWSMLLDFWYHA